MNRSEARMKALQALYQLDMNEVSVDEAIDNVAQDEDRTYLFQLVQGVITHIKAIDQKISNHLKGWKLERISYIDRNILRLGAYEIIYETELPDAVAIDEAIELAKKFSDEKSSKFINGVLSSIMKEKREQG